MKQFFVISMLLICSVCCYAQRNNNNQRHQTVASKSSSINHTQNNRSSKTNKQVGIERNHQKLGIETINVNGVSFKMCYVKGGIFLMGATSKQELDADDNEQPPHKVALNDYYIGQTEVTQILWQTVMGNNPSYFIGDNLPVEQVSWKDCQTFIEKLNAKTGRTFRLPTEAEWEFASRGGNKTHGFKYCGSNDPNDVAWYESNSNGETQNVATKQANELGIYDMSGNVWEWCADWYGDYNSNIQTNPTGPKNGTDRVNRGGCWGNVASDCRSSVRQYDDEDFRNHCLGFRLALSL